MRGAANDRVGSMGLSPRFHIFLHRRVSCTVAPPNVDFVTLLVFYLESILLAASTAAEHCAWDSNPVEMLYRLPLMPPLIPPYLVIALSLAAVGAGGEAVFP